MPQYKTHLVGGVGAFGIVCLLALSHNPSIGTLFEWFVFALLGSLFPDIDTKSKGQKIFYRIISLLFLYYVFQGNIVYLSIIGAAAFLPLLVRHRGLFHRVWFILLIGFITILWTFLFFPRYTYIVYWDVLFFSAGVLSHIWLDLGIKRMLKYK